MPKPTPPSVREAISARVAAGQDAARIAAEMGLPARTARSLAAACGEGGPVPPPDSSACGRPAAAAFEPLRLRALAMRREHPRWGVRLIRSLLAVPDGAARPCIDTVARWM